MDNKEINGPVNIIRLENKDMNKTIYLICDIHNDLNNQTKCENFDALDIAQFLNNFFKKTSETNLTYDFMFEQNINSNNPYKNKFSQIKSSMYIRSIGKLILNYFDYDIISDKKTKEEKLIIHKSKKNINVRFHYIDVRLDYYLNEYDKLIHFNNSRYYNWQIDFIDSLFLIKKEMLYMVNILNNNKLEKKTIQHKFVYKIKFKYKNDNIKKIINSLIDNQIKKLVYNIIKKIDNLVKLVNNEATKENQFYSKDGLLKKNKNCLYGQPFIEQKKSILLIQEKLDDFDYLIMNFYCSIMDLYTIRRFLDKNYITNAILYTGIFHSLNILPILVKYFKFNITHASYKEKSINELNKIYQKVDYNLVNNICSYHTHLMPEHLHQCSNLKGFPDMFK